MAINTNYSSSTISYLNDPRYTSPDPGADDKMLKYADGLTQDKHNGGFHVDYGNWFVGETSYDAYNHGDPTLVSNIKNWAGVLRSGTSSPEDKATARRELASLIPQQMLALKSDTSGIKYFSESNGYDILVNNGKIKSDTYFQSGFDPKRLNTLTANAPETPQGLDSSKAASQLTGDMDPKNLNNIALQLQTSGDSDLQALGTKLEGLLKNVQDRRDQGAKDNDVLLNVSATAITDLMTNQIQPYQAAMQAHIAFTNSSTTPGDAGAQAGAEAISQLDTSKLPNGLQAELQADLDLYNKRNPTATQLSLLPANAAPGTVPATGSSNSPSTDPSAGTTPATGANSQTPASLQGTTVGAQTYVVNPGDNLTSIGTTALNAAYQQAGRGSPATEDIARFVQQLIALNLNQPMNDQGAVMTDANIIQPGWNINLPAINVPGAQSNISLPANIRYSNSVFNPA